MLYNMYTIIILHVWVAIINNYDCLLLMNHAEGYAPWCFHLFGSSDCCCCFSSSYLCSSFKSPYMRSGFPVNYT